MLKVGGGGMDDDGDNASHLPESGGGGWVEICESGDGGSENFPYCHPSTFSNRIALFFICNNNM